MLHPITGRRIKAYPPLPGPKAMAMAAPRRLRVPRLRAGPVACDDAQAPAIPVLDMVAHELRNALMPIRLAAAQLGSPHTDASHLPRLRATIDQQVNLMARLIGDLLDNARARTGKLRLTCIDMDLADVLARAVSACRPAMAARAQHLALHLPTARVLPFHGDPDRILQIISNLLDNACKYTACGGTILMSVTQSHERIALTISDNGIGIAAHGLAHIFDPFVQTDHAVRFNGVGLGIGLSLVRDLVEAHGGQVTAHSPGLGLGSQFTVIFPCGKFSSTPVPTRAVGGGAAVLRAPLQLQAACVHEAVG